MYDVLSRRKAASNGQPRDNMAAGDFDECPQISRLLCGVKQASGEKYEHPAFTLCLWAEGSLVKFCFRSDDCPEKLYGAVNGISDVLRKIEQAIESEQCEWKVPRFSKEGFSRTKSNGSL